MHSTIFIFANFIFLWEVPSDVESTAAQDGAKRSPERKQRCWQEPLDGERSAPGNPACRKGTLRLCSPLPAPGAGTRLSLQQLLPPVPRQLSHLQVTGHGWVCATHGWKHHPLARQARRGCAPALKQQALSSEWHTVVPTKTVLLLLMVWVGIVLLFVMSLGSFFWDMSLYQLLLHCPSIEVSCCKYCIFQALRFPIWFLQHIFHTILFQTSTTVLRPEEFLISGNMCM